MEYWKNGRMGKRNVFKPNIPIFLHFIQHSIIPIFHCSTIPIFPYFIHYSNFGEQERGLR